MQFKGAGRYVYNSLYAANPEAPTLFLTITLQHRPTIYCQVYRPPSWSNFDHFNHMLKKKKDMLCYVDVDDIYGHGTSTLIFDLDHDM